MLILLLYISVSYFVLYGAFVSYLLYITTVVSMIQIYLFKMNTCGQYVTIHTFNTM